MIGRHTWGDLLDALVCLIPRKLTLGVWKDGARHEEDLEEPQSCDVGLNRRAGKRLVAQECDEQRDFLNGDEGGAIGKLEGKRLIFAPARPVYL